MEANMIDAVIIFVDARGFTSWAEQVDVFKFIEIFSLDFQEILHDTFSDFNIKNLGDGAMMIKEIEEKNITPDFLKKTLLDFLKRINNVEAKFSSMCKRYGRIHGCQIPLMLGWGITRGGIKKVENDYIGPEINKSSRLCGIARPYGIVIDKDDFSLLPKFPQNFDITLYAQKRKLKGINKDVNIWATKAIANQFITREDLKETPEVHIAGICIKEEHGLIHALIAKRNNSRSLFPNLYEGCGGQLAHNELFTSGVKRHYELELNIDVEVVEESHKFYYIQQPKEPLIPGIKFLCIYKSGEPKSENHSEVKWVSEDQLKSIPENYFIKGLKQDFIDFIEIYKKNKS